MVVVKTSLAQCNITDVACKRGLDSSATWGFYASRTAVDTYTLTSCELNKLDDVTINTCHIQEKPKYISPPFSASSSKTQIFS